MYGLTSLYISYKYELDMYVNIDNFIYKSYNK